jgi:hypothetical protein
MWNMVAQLAQHNSTDAPSNYPIVSDTTCDNNALNNATLALKDQGSRETEALSNPNSATTDRINIDTDTGNNPMAVASNPNRNIDTEASNQHMMAAISQSNTDTNALNNPTNALMDQGYMNNSVSTESSITDNPDEEDPQDDEEDDDFINNLITFKDTASPESAKCNNLNPQLTEYESDSEIKLDSGTQICMFKYCIML